ncbi:MAG TPA: hypothetical protein VFK05_09140 [Polyangiaceae bacterium]|nr:hypothetical protein [Polyangiaceae bacterium]
MKQTALLLTFLASLPLGACTMATGEVEGGEESSSTTEPVLTYIKNPAPTVIDFDRDPAQATIVDGTIVDTTYASLGVTFSCMGCASGHAFARAPGRSGNGVSVFASPTFNLFDARFGGVVATFTTPRKSVTIDALAVLPVEYLGTPVAKPWLQAFDAAGHVIGSTAYYPAYGTTGFGQWQTLRIDDPTGSIKSVRFSSQHFNDSPAVYAVFDNLTFNTDPYWADVDIVIQPVKPQRPILLQPLP